MSTLQPQSIKKTSIKNTMSEAYLEYAMSVIVGRALPDARDGLKPVHRRILYAMNSQNALHNRPYIKSARVVGEVTGKYHPHGETAVYDATVRLAQDFSSRYQLVDGQGNFGSVDGDPPAAMRYTEIRLQKITQELLTDLDKETVDFNPNYDDSLREPSVLPTKIPTLLLNGSNGIAVGMATNIPPHNLSEIVDGLLYVIEDKENINTAHLLTLVKGPDFPTGANILGTKGVQEVYKTGRGSVIIRSETHVEQLKNNNREAIVVTELPYAVNKARLIEKIALLAKEKKINGIHDLRDESDRKGMRIVIELKRGEQPEPILAFLYKHTALQTSFGTIMLAVVNGKPVLLSLADILKLFIEYRIEIVERRTQFELRKAEEKAHLLEGLSICLKNIDEVVTLIRSSATAADAKKELIQRFDLSERQAQSILDMRLQRLTALEREKIENDLKETQKLIDTYKIILNDEQKVLDIIKEELLTIKKEYGDKRITRILEEDGEINFEDTMPEESMVVTLSREGYVKRCSIDEYQTQKRGGKGKIGMTTKDQDIAHQMITASTHDTLLMFSNFGKVYLKKVYEIPLAGRTARGRAIVNVLPLAEKEIIMSCLPVSTPEKDSFIVMATRNGVVKKSSLEEYMRKRSNGTKAIVIDKDDNLVAARLCKKNDLIFVATRNGLSLKFPSDQLRTQGRVTRGPRGIRLKDFDGKQDYVVSLEIINRDGFLLTVSEKGYGKKSKTGSYRLGSRSNSGVLNMKMTERNGKVVGTLFIEKGDQLMLITNSSKIIRIDTDQIHSLGRVTQGVKLIQVAEEESVIFVSKVFTLNTSQK